jgi:hypothetical protein
MRSGLTIVKGEDGIKFYGEITSTDLIKLKLDSVDLCILNNCPINAPPEDHLLVLEMLFRRMNQQYRG